MVVNAESRERVKETLRNDIFVKEGIWDWDRVQILPFKTIVRQPAEKSVDWKLKTKMDIVRYPWKGEYVSLIGIFASITEASPKTVRGGWWLEGEGAEGFSATRKLQCPPRTTTTDWTVKNLISPAGMHDLYVHVTIRKSFWKDNDRPRITNCGQQCQVIFALQSSRPA